MKRKRATRQNLNHRTLAVHSTPDLIPDLSQRKRSLSSIMSRRKHHSPSYMARHERNTISHANRQLAHPRQMSYNLTPARAFFILRKRIEFLNGKIISRMDAGEHYSLYLEEREAMIWLMDTVNRLSGKKIVELYEFQESAV